MPPEFRIATVTGWLSDLDYRLSSRHYASSRTTPGLRQQILDFTANALPRNATREAG